MANISALKFDEWMNYDTKVESKPVCDSSERSGLKEGEGTP